MILSVALTRFECLLELGQIRGRATDAIAAHLQHAASLHFTYAGTDNERNVAFFASAGIDRKLVSSKFV